MEIEDPKMQTNVEVVILQIELRITMLCLHRGFLGGLQKRRGGKPSIIEFQNDYETSCI